MSFFPTVGTTRQKARRFAAAFEREGFSVWWDQTLHSGENYDQVTESALREAKAVVVLWSRKSVDSRWVRAEATTADRAGTLVPAMIEPCNRPIMFELKHTAELAHWKGEPNDPAWKAFVADVHRFVRKGEPAASTPVVAQAAKRSWSTALALWLLVAAVLLAGAAVWAVMHWGGRQASSAASSAAPTAAAAAPVTLAVLPFADMSPAKDQEYFADGMTEEILNSLAQVRDLRVTGRTSSFHFKGRNEDMESIGKQLGVSYLLEGSVRRDGGQLRITAQLVKASDGFHVWSHTYDRQLIDVFKVQADIARDVAQALQVKFGVGELGENPGMTRDLDAYDSYLKGITFDGNGEYEKALAAFEQAVEQDRDFGLAWVQILENLRIISQARNGGRAAEIQHANAEITRLMPESVQLRTSEAFASIERLDYDEAARQFAAARVLAVTQTRNSAGIRQLDHDEGIFLQGIDAADKALTVYTRYRTRNPLSTTNEGDMAIAFAAAGREAEAREEILQVFANLDKEGRSGPSSQLTGRLIALGDIGQPGMRELLTRIERFGDGEALLVESLDRQDAARRELRRLSKTTEATIFDEFVLAAWAAHYGEPEIALEQLRRMGAREEGRAHWLLPLLWQPLMKDVRRLPGFKDLVSQLRLVDYWRKNGWGKHCQPVGTAEFECT